MRCLVVLMCITASVAGAQQPVPPPAAPADSAHVESVPVPLPPPTPEQKRFVEGLRTATRGIAQLKDGLNRVTRTQAKRDSVNQQRAGRLLAGLCGSARGFMARGRPYLKPAVYEDSTRLKARRLTTQMDSLIAYMPACEQGARATPSAIATELAKRVKTYDLTYRDFRAAIGLPLREDSSKAARRP
jgi:hypothetical protein